MRSIVSSNKGKTYFRQVKILFMALIIMAAGILWILSSSVTMQLPYYTEQVDAAEKMATIMEAIKGYKEQLGIPLPPYDYFETGMLGEPFNGMTTSLGELEAKRTTANPAMAALAVRLFHEAGVEGGDRVGLGFSGSFPAMNIAVLAAADVMDLEVIPITSVGASTYGANNPALTFPEMMHALYRDGLITTDSLIVTMGGDFDTGANMMPEDADVIRQRLKDDGYNLYEEPDLALNVRARLLHYGDMQALVIVGGNVTSAGTTADALTLGQGLLMPSLLTYDTAPSTDDGVIQYALADTVPVIYYLNIKKIVDSYGMPFDPIAQDAIGEGRIYETVYYPKWRIVVAFAAGIAVLMLLKRKQVADE
ncbi:poly-gamma-glutamate system protein [Fusibacter paucivorans]|uniref:Poly-gamma-glutamate system protein n=1 Tax=Fusibacter paucivorans TaxID=76009 RepID=A0ABS5PLB5_9FIRM|nr:poly-gamma-glutamate system protein [Fusibacter paucivorans]MBS7525184.1 poly-gamma-glutamate system protein [Fusibacter paucivorans]